MFIPNELLLNVLLFADFSTLVYAKFVDTKFLGVVTANEHLLAVQHRFHIIFLNMGIVYSDLTKSGLRKIMHYSRSKPASVERACRNLADVIGQHSVVILCFAEQASVKPAVDVIFELIPALKFTQDARINIPHSWHAGGNSEAVMRNFARLKSLSLDIDHDLFRHFNWSFLSLDAARELRTVTVTLTNRSSEYYMEYDASAAVLLMTSTLEGSGRETTIKLKRYVPRHRMSVRLCLEGNARFDAVDTGAAIMRYSSRTSRVTLQVTGEYIIVCSVPANGVPADE